VGTLSNRQKDKYVPSVKDNGALCEVNYYRFCQLLDADSKTECFEIQSPQGHLAEITLTVIERFKWTCTVQVDICHHGFPHEFGQDLGRQQLMVRIYDDMRMAEVVASGQGNQFQGVYPYPNEQMFQVDEKIQLNKYLAEWLTWLKDHGMKKIV
jgi:uncharacterized protein